jgi:hypothetical protein
LYAVNVVSNVINPSRETHIERERETQIDTHIERERDRKREKKSGLDFGTGP